MSEGALSSQIALPFRKHLTEFSLFEIWSFSQFFLAVSVNTLISFSAVRIQEIRTNFGFVE